MSGPGQDGPPRVGFVGLGQMGAAMAGRLVGWPGGLLVHDVRREAAGPLVARGAVAAGSLGELAAAANVISVMVVDDAQVTDVVEAVLHAAREGTVVALHSTIRDSTAVRLAGTARSHGVTVVDAPVSGGVLGAEAGRLAVMVGGELSGFERCREPFGRFADLVVHCGPVGAGTRTKLARNLVNFVGIGAALEAARLASAAGVDLRRLHEVTTHSDAVTGGPGAVLATGVSGPLRPDDPMRAFMAHTRDLGEKDLMLALDLGRRLGVEMPLAGTTYRHLAEYLGVAGDAAPDPAPEEDR